MAEKKRSHAVYDLNYHIVLVTKYRRPVLAGEVAEHLKRECIRLIDEKEGAVREIETDMDHVHILAELSPKYPVTGLINSLKGVTSRILRRDHWDEISKDLWGDSLWSESYYVATAGGVTIDTIRQYVQSQKTDAHKRKYVKSGKPRKACRKKRAVSRKQANSSPA